MTETSGSKRFLTGRWLLPMNADPIPYGVVEIDGPRIKRIFTAEQFGALPAQLSASQIENYGDAIILPGLINLHTHLEYSILHLLDTQSDLFDWIPKLMGHVKTWSPATFIRSATLGAQQMAWAGTTCILDSSFSGLAAVGAARAGLRALVALELFGIVESDTDNLWSAWCQRKDDLQRRLQANEHEGFGETADAIANGMILLSVAPHAPYTVGPSLTRKAMQWAESQGVAWTMHVAETVTERQWVESGDSRLDAFLQKVHRPPDGKVENIAWRNCGKSPVAHLYDNDILQSSLVAAHVVQVDDNDIIKLAERKVSVAHCARSNSRLRSGIAPLARMLSQGVSVGFGTDSAASTDDLDVLAEARFAWNLHRALHSDIAFNSQEAIYRLTAGAAKAIGLGSDIGTLEAGKFADIAIFNISGSSEVARERPYDLLLYGNLPIRDLFVSGKKVLKTPYTNDYTNMRIV